MTSPGVEWLIYALGSGFGHLTRASALARAAAEIARVRILTNCPYAANVQRAMPELDIVALDPETEAEIVHQIELANPDCLIVDTFPRGMVGELVNIVASFPGLKVFVQRDLNPEYVAAYDLENLISKSYDLVLRPEDWAAPWLVRSHSELVSRDEARARLTLDPRSSCVIVCAAGKADELIWYRSVVASLLAALQPPEVRCFAPVCPPRCPPEYWRSYWPAMDFYAAADVVIGGAGYNTINECLACGVPLIARPWSRQYDRQNLRATLAARHGSVTLVETSDQAAKAALDFLASPRPTRQNSPFRNGAAEAAARIHKLVLASNRSV